MIYNLFITHAWRYHDPWNDIINILDTRPNFQWRNFSVPWYDPALYPHDPDDYRRICDWLESQIKPADIILLLEDIYAVKSNRKWLELELQMAHALQKPIFVIQGKEGSVAANLPTNLDSATKIIPFDAEHILTAITTMRF